MWKCTQLSIITLLLIILCCHFPLHAQEYKQKDRAPWSFGTNGYYGALFRYRAGISTLNFTHPVGVEIYAHKHTIGKRAWEEKYKYPQIGFALSYYNYGVPAELGEAVSLTSYLDNAIIARKRGSLRFNVGTGIVYSTRYYTPVSNEMNKAIGSPITFALRATLRYEFPISEHTFLNVNLAFRHFSNGGLNKPNNGMNFPLLGMGLRYQPRKAYPKATPDVVNASATDKRFHLNLRLVTGVKEVLLIDTKHAVYSISLYASKRLTQTNSFLIGMDATFDSALREEFINKSLPVPEGELDPRMAGISIGHELHMNKLSLVVQVGRYLHQPLGLFPNYYQRYGLKYNICRNISANAILMAHTRTANVIEWGLGFHL